MSFIKILLAVGVLIAVFEWLRFLIRGFQGYGCKRMPGRSWPASGASLEWIKPQKAIHKEKATLWLNFTILSFIILFLTYLGWPWEV